MTQQGPPLLDRGMPRRMRLGDACIAYAAFCAGASVVMAVASFAIVWVIDWAYLVPCSMMAGAIIMAPLGCAGIAIVWRLRLGEKYSAKLRPGDFRFAGLMSPVAVWVLSALSRYAAKLPEGFTIAAMFVVPVILAGLTTWFATDAAIRRK